MQKNIDKEFQRITANGPARDLAILLNDIIAENSIVIDLGCGSGIDSQHFVENGHTVIAIDREVSVIEEKKKALAKEQFDRLNIVKADFNEMDLPKANVVYASYSLPFCGNLQFNNTWKKQFETLNVETIVGIVLFGQKDEWYGSNEYLIFHSDEEVKALFNTFEILHYENVEYEGECMSSDGSIMNKHWNVINVVAVKKQ